MRNLLIKVVMLMASVLIVGCKGSSERAPANSEFADTSGEDFEFMELDTSGEDLDSLLYDGGLESSLRPVLRPRTQVLSKSILADKYPPRVSKFNSNSSVARGYTNEKWLSLSSVEKAKHIHDVAENLINAHGFQNKYSPRVVTCKTWRESAFSPQIGNSASSAKGISQVVDGTVDAVFQLKNFRFKTPGFEDVRRSSTFRNRMARSMNAQIELGIAVFEVKRKEGGVGTRSILKKYYGSTKDICNDDYATRVLDCAQCVKDYGFSTNCLNKAKGIRKECKPRPKKKK